MRKFVELLGRFRSDERGAFLVIFGLLVIVLVATGGAVVDYTSMEQARTRAQVALDAAALGLQPSIFDAGVTEATIQPQAQRVLLQRLNESGQNWVACTNENTPPPCAAIDDVTINLVDGSLILDARIRVGMSFVALVGIDQMEAGVLSEATRRRLNLEVAMVLDNSNSMADSSRMTHLIAATRCAANILLNSDCLSTATTSANNRTRISIVPFTMLVNVGTDKASASWMDRTGSGVNNNAVDNFDDDDRDDTPFAGPIDRIAIINQMGGVDWGGCVEARVSPFDTTDEPAVPGTNTMFTPLFAPDRPGVAVMPGVNPPPPYLGSYLSDTPASCTRRPPTWTAMESKTVCNLNGNNNANNFNTATCANGGAITLSNQSQTNVFGVAVNPAATAQPANFSAASYYNEATCTFGSYTSVLTGSNPNRWTNRRIRTCVYNFSTRELQERLCKYTGATPNANNVTYAHGPNSDCPANAILALTSEKEDIMDAIADLAPQGGTNIHAGAEWGMRTLSPSEPFPEGLPYGDATSKVLIIMTDGENTAYQTNNINNSNYYSHYGFPWNGRMGTGSSTNAQLETEMNTRLLATCNHAKGLGMTVYTIGLSVNLTRNPAVNEQLLKDCSNGTGFWFFPTRPSDLTTVFTQIAQQLADLRLAR